MKKFLLFVPLIASLGIFYLPNTAKAACVLSSVNWDKQRIAVGESVRLTVVGSGCPDVKVITKIYEADTVSDDLIKTTEAIFPSTNAPTVAQTITFSSADYALGNDTGEGSEEEIYVKASIVNMPATTVTSSRIVLAAPVTGGCQLSTAQWRWSFRDQPIVGSPVQLVVNGANCAGNTVGLDIYEEDTGVVDDRMPSQLSATFNSAGTQAVANWNVNGSWDDDDLGSYMFYFRAAAGQSIIPKSGILNNGSGIPLRSGKGCLNCNAVFAPNPVQCSDGTSQPRGTFANAEDACNGHIGDSLGGNVTYACNAGGVYACGTKADCSDAVGCSATTRAACTKINASLCGKPFGSGPSETAPKSYFFSITNPLKGGPNDLFDIINIVTKWIMLIAIPLAVLYIMWAGFLMLTAGPVPANFQKGKDIIWYVVIGLAIIFIGKGFVTLIISIIQLGGTP